MLDNAEISFKETLNELLLNNRQSMQPYHDLFDPQSMELDIVQQL